MRTIQRLLLIVVALSSYCLSSCGESAEQKFHEKFSEVLEKRRDLIRFILQNDLQMGRSLEGQEEFVSQMLSKHEQINVAYADLETLESNIRGKNSDKAGSLLAEAAQSQKELSQLIEDRLAKHQELKAYILKARKEMNLRPVVPRK